MFLVFGQFWNQTTGAHNWQQIGGVCTSEQDAEQFAYGFAINYGMTTKTVGRKGVKMYLPPEKKADALQWPVLTPDVLPRGEVISGFH